MYRGRDVAQVEDCRCRECSIFIFCFYWSGGEPLAVYQDEYLSGLFVHPRTSNTKTSKHSVCAVIYKWRCRILRISIVSSPYCSQCIVVCAPYLASEEEQPNNSNDHGGWRPHHLTTWRSWHVVVVREIRTEQWEPKGVGDDITPHRELITTHFYGHYMKPGINMHKAKRRRTRGKYLETLTQVPGVQTLAVENKQARGYMTRVRTLSLVSPEEKAAGDGGDARGDHEFDIDQIGSRFTPASLAAALKPHCVSGSSCLLEAYCVLRCILLFRVVLHQHCTNLLQYSPWVAWYRWHLFHACLVPVPSSLEWQYTPPCVGTNRDRQIPAVVLGSACCSSVSGLFG